MAARGGSGFRAPPPREELAPRRALRQRRETALSDAARSLTADFAGARGDIAQRRRRGEASVPRLPESPRRAQRAARLARGRGRADDALSRGDAARRPGAASHRQHRRRRRRQSRRGADRDRRHPRLRPIGRHRARRRGRRRERAHLRARSVRDAVAHRDLHRCGRERRPRGRTKPEAAVAQGGRIVILPLDRLGDLAQAGAPTA